MVLYQPTIQTFKYSIWKFKWVRHEVYPSTVVFKSDREAEAYKQEYISGLQRRYINLNRGRYTFYLNQLIYHTEQTVNNE
jgi:hypothetical protein